VTQDRSEGSKDVHLRTAGDRDDLGPPGTAVGDGEGVTVVSCCLPSVMTHEVHLHVPGRRCREFPEGHDRDEGKEAPGLCPGTMLPFAFSALSRRSIVADPMWRSATRRGSGSMLPLRSRAHRSSGVAACNLPSQNSPARCSIQTSPSTTAGPCTCFRWVRHGDGLV
jgi:hypothetical protein